MIHLGKDETFVPLETGTAAITYKLTKTLNLHVGDTVRVYLPGDDEPVYHRPSAKSSTTTSRRAFISTARHGNPSARANSSPPA